MEQVQQVKELYPETVAYVSLVRKPANKIPFRFIKQDEDSNMGGINLNGLFKFKKNAESGKSTDLKGGSFLGILLKGATEEQAQAIATSLPDAGLTHLFKKDGEGFIVHNGSLNDVDEKDLKFIDVTANATAIFKGALDGKDQLIKKSAFLGENEEYFYDFYWSMQDATERLFGHVKSAVVTETNQSGFNTIVNQLVGDYAAYTIGLLTSVPLDVMKVLLTDTFYKADTTEPATEAKAEPTPEPVAEPVTTPVAEPVAEPAPVEEPVTEPAVDAPVTEPVVEPATDITKSAEPVVTGNELSELLSLVKSIKESQEATTAIVKSVQQKQESQDLQFAQLGADVESAKVDNEQIKKSVAIVSNLTGEDGEAEKITKSEPQDLTYSGNFDTAFNKPR